MEEMRLFKIEISIQECQISKFTIFRNSLRTNTINFSGFSKLINLKLVKMSLLHLIIYLGQTSQL